MCVSLCMLLYVCMCVCVATDEEPETEDILVEDTTSGSEARNETGITVLHVAIRQVKQDNLELWLDWFVFHSMADDDIDHEADLQEEQIVSWWKQTSQQLLEHCIHCPPLFCACTCTCIAECAHSPRVRVNGTAVNFLCWWISYHTCFSFS